MRATLFENATANGDSDPVVWTGGADREGTLSIWGTWDGATVSLLYTPDDGATYIPVAASTWQVSSAHGQAVEYDTGLHSVTLGFDLGRFPIIVRLESAGGSTDLNVGVRS